MIPKNTVDCCPIIFDFFTLCIHRGGQGGGTDYFHVIFCFPQAFFKVRRCGGLTRSSHQVSLCSLIPTVQHFVFKESIFYNVIVSNRLQMSNTFYEAAGQNWFTLDSVHIHYNWTQEATFNASEVYAPATSSYHCQHVSSLHKYDTLLVPSSHTDTSANWHITFTDFQVQHYAGHFASYHTMST